MSTVVGLGEAWCSLKNARCTGDRSGTTHTSLGIVIHREGIDATLRMRGMGMTRTVFSYLVETYRYHGTVYVHQRERGRDDRKAIEIIERDQI
jgi:hypothetical protein